MWVAFHGVADGKNPDVLSVGEGPGIASGIGIALFDSQGQQLPLNRPRIAGYRSTADRRR
jgi:fimbrial protein